ncbi:MAG: hypothetical protein IT443_12310 [Phycisphaeraceae bacterium]|nr:hypothetical protein [Phycisphaeraceae bacterium]
MSIKSLARAGSWATITVMALLTTWGIGLVVIFKAGWLTGQRWEVVLAVALGSIFAAVLPWWALAAVLAQRWASKLNPPPACPAAES